MTCQDILHGRNRRISTPSHPLAGGLLTCAFCGQAITGERIRRKLRGGAVREHLYYRCANNEPGPKHPNVRWTADDLEQAIVEDLHSLRLPNQEMATWFRSTLQTTLGDLLAHHQRHDAALKKRQSEVATMHDRLLNTHLAGTIEEPTFQAKSAELRAKVCGSKRRSERRGRQTRNRTRGRWRSLTGPNVSPMSGAVQKSWSGGESSTRSV